MKIEDLILMWGNAPTSDCSFQRIDETHILDVYVGRSSELQNELMVVSDIEPSKIDSSKAISIIKGMRKDQRWATRIKLLNEGEKEVFTYLCWDLIEQSRKASSKSLALEIFIARFLKWQKLMERGNDLLSESVIRGLIGEILYAQKVLRENFSWDEILVAWLGPDGADRDFTFYDTWAEVKTIKPGKQSITISSIEQLDSEKEGTLAVVVLEDTSATDTCGFSFAGLIEKFRSELRATPSAMFHFERKLMEIGYSEHTEYYDKYYAFKSIKQYWVKDNFPRLRQADLPVAILQVRYDISLGHISIYQTEV